MKKIRIMFCCFILCIISSRTAYADEPLTAEKTVIFVVDTSGSMQTNDPDRLAIDSISQFIYSLPTDYKVGLVAYSTSIDALQEPVSSADRKKAADLAAGLRYEGYSNAGEGLAAAVRLLADDNSQNQYIILLSDGEILLEDELQTSEAAKQYRTAVEQAKAQGITVHVIGLGSEMSDMDSTIFSAADETGGSTFFEEKAQGIQDAVDTIRKDKFGVKQSTLAIVDADGTVESISAKLPYIYADKIRILITCEKPITNLKVNLQAESAVQVNGSRYAVIEINKPMDEQLEVSFEGVADSRVWVHAIPEYRVIPQADIEYTDTVPQDADLLVEHPYERTAHIAYSFVSADNPAVRLWENAYFDHGRIGAVIKRDAEETYADLYLDEGFLFMQEQVTNGRIFEIQFDYADLSVNVIGTDTLSVELEAAPMIPAEEPQPPYLLITIVVACFVLAAIAVLVIILWQKKRQKPIPLPPDMKPEPGKYSFVGKLNIYITRTRSGYDIPPLSYDLFRLPPGKVISLYEVLDSCAIRERFAGAETIYLKAGGGRSLILTNNSDCTIMKNREILLKTRSYQLTPDSKVDITFEDEISELAFQYKDVKLSGMH